MDPTQVRENNWAKTHNSTDPSQDAGTKKFNQNNNSTGSSPSQPDKCANQKLKFVSKNMVEIRRLLFENYNFSEKNERVLPFFL